MTRAGKETRCKFEAVLSEAKILCICRYIDWDPYVPTFLTRIQYTFDLPVKYKDVAVHKKLALGDLGSSVKWIVSTLGGNTITIKYLEQMFNSLDSYYHTANFGPHTQRLNDLLYKLTHSFTRRLHKERYERE